jgi:hypothetical protein
MNYTTLKLNHGPQDVLLSKGDPVRQKHEYDFKAKADRTKRIITGITLYYIHITLSGQA